VMSRAERFELFARYRNLTARRHPCQQYAIRRTQVT
jgi:hypothetical protein